MFTLSQALEAIKNKPEFTLRDRGEYSVIDYNLSDRDTFVGSNLQETLILLNLRGTVFLNSTGQIIRLPFEKFFNYGEFPDSDATLDFSSEHSITQKLDGSMISTWKIGKAVYFGTRAGVTDIAMMAQEFAESTKDSDYFSLIDSFHSMGCTPIFEFCSRKNRVVIDYHEDKLVLLAVRNIADGSYISYKQILHIGSAFSVPVVKQYDSTDAKSFNQFKKSVSEFKNDEGVVIRFKDGRAVKLKSTEYCLQHKAIDQLKFTKDLLKLALVGKLDDVIPLLSTDKAAEVAKFTQHFFDKLNAKCFEIIDEFSKYSSIEVQKDFAEAIKDSKHKSFLFRMRKGEDPYGLLVQHAMKNCSTNPLCENLQEFLNMEFAY